jgi:acyl-CoA dehydrogenase
MTDMTDKRARAEGAGPGHNSGERLARTLFAPEHEQFRDTVRRFIRAEMLPHYAAWEEAGVAPRDIWLKAGAAGILGTSIPEAYGGSGAGFHFDAVVVEELSRHFIAGPAWELHSYIVAPYLLAYGTEAQKQRWLPGMASGEIITSIAMTEPDGGSDLKAVRTTAVRDGDDYVINGSKTFITNGIAGDMVVLVAKTAPALGAKGISLFLVDTSTAGYRKGRNLKKIGNKASDTAELFFDDVRVPADSLLGGENEGWRCLMGELVQERLLVAIRAMATCEAALEETVEYTRLRKAFGQTIFDFQNTRFKLADAAAEIQVGRVFVDRCIELHAERQLDMRTAAMAKLWTTELQHRVLDDCLQFHGGYGYMWEFPIARAWADARVHRIYAGSNEIMREIIARGL